MKSKVIILFLLCSFAAGAQSFAPVGAQWIYNDHDSSNHNNFPRGIYSITDTVINGNACHMIVGDCACGTGVTNYEYEINGKVYWYNNLLNGFTLLYDFNLNAGDSWNVLAQNTSGDSLTVRVDSIRMDTINGNLRKVQFVSTSAMFGNAYIFPGPIVEGIGSKFCLYPQYAACDAPTAGLRCYQDSIVGFYDTHFAPACEEVFVDSGIGVREISTKVVAIISPNPFHEVSTLSLQYFSSQEGIFELVDVTGRIILTEKFSGNEIKIERNNLDEGIYFYRLKIEDSFSVGKLIVD